MTYLIIGSLFILGAILASFTAVVAERLYTGQSWVNGRSRCNSCSEALAPIDLVPVLSWLFLGGRCRQCGSKVPYIYAVGELFLGTLFALAYIHLGLTLSLIPLLVAFVILTFIVLYDLRHTIVPPIASTLLITASLVYAVLAYGITPMLGAALLMAGIVGLLFFLLFAFSRGRAMGLGDSPVALALALLVGGGLALPGLLFSFWIGAIIGIGILVSRPKGHRMGIEVPFVPFLALGYLLAFFTQWNPLFFTL